MSRGHRRDPATTESVPAQSAVEPAPEQPLTPHDETSSVTLHPSEIEVPVSEPLDELEALRQERDQLRDQLLRRRADFENYKRRVERDRQQAAQEALAGVFRALVPTLDNLERALGASGDEASVRDGVSLIRRDLLGFLEGQGVVVEDPLGERFDPTRHQALSHEPTAGFEEGAVVEVYQKGYSLRDRLLRPALVKVASANRSDQESGGGQLH